MVVQTTDQLLSRLFRLSLFSRLLRLDEGRGKMCFGAEHTVSSTASARRPKAQHRPEQINPFSFHPTITSTLRNDLSKWAWIDTEGVEKAQTCDVIKKIRIGRPTGFQHLYSGLRQHLLLSW